MKFIIFIRSLVFNILFALITGFYGSLVLLSMPFGRKAQLFFVDRYSDTFLLAAKYVVGLSYSIEGAENIPKDEAFITWCKHQSLYECYILQQYLPRHTWVFKKILLHIPFFGWGLRAIDPVPIDRKGGRSAVDQIIEKGTDRLDNGIGIMLFPEGTRMPVGKTRKYGRSGAFLSVKSGYKIVPIAHNSGEFWRRGDLLIDPGVVKVVIGKPIDPTGKTPAEITIEAKTWVEKTMREISPVYAEKAAFYEARGDQDSSGDLKDSRKK